MTTNKYKETGLWKTAFAGKFKSECQSECTRLESEYDRFRSKVAILVGSIAGVLPGLTIHDVTHLDALWQTADVIGGINYPLNPLEAFVLGGAILLHDSAMCWEAYEGGREKVRKTVQWKDAFAAVVDENPGLPPDEQEHIADFLALRALHAHQAEKLIEHSWQDPSSGQQIYLIDDSTLRLHLGKLIGKIAASHHWDIDDLSGRLGQQFNPLPEFPSAWVIDPIKVACLLRCADAAHINHLRAPDFQIALAKRGGVSRQHWLAQNKMMGPNLDRGDPSGKTILYTSSRPYPPEESDAWWVAFDSVSVVANELRSCQRLLESRNRPDTAPPFSVCEVKGAYSVLELKELLEPQGWLPSDTKIHVSDIESLVRNLGGEKLYSGANKLEVVLRELIQNARDAVCARRFVDNGYEGEIHIRYERSNNESWLTVEDDGVGMSRTVLTQTLLSFGKSFWKSSLVQSEFPGLRASKFRAVGQFGIGFFSVFMIAQSVSVRTRKYVDGLDDVLSLQFKNGISFRPILQEGRPANFSSRASTQICLKLLDDAVPTGGCIEIPSGIAGAKNIHSTLSAFIDALVAALDVKVTYSEGESSKKTLSNGAELLSDTALAYLEKASLCQYQQSPEVCRAAINAYSPRMRHIKQDGVSYGFAALATESNTSQFRLGISLVGLFPAITGSRGSENYVGYLTCNPNTARRDAGKTSAPREALENWHQEQIKLLISMEASAYQLNIAAVSASNMELDPLSFGNIFVCHNSEYIFLTYEDAVMLAMHSSLLIMKSRHYSFIETHHHVRSHPTAALFIVTKSGSALDLEFDDGAPKNSYSVIGCLFRAAASKGVRLEMHTKMSEHPSLAGGMDELWITAHYLRPENGAA
ncbi:hypothetical protein CSQ96_10770 [Janthinobacterium sp. BJB412]|nr:hypothetical protein CSQ96_10770 [Janthinobacterium sp. BJB412]